MNILGENHQYSTWSKYEIKKSWIFSDEGISSSSSPLPHRPSPPMSTFHKSEVGANTASYTAAYIFWWVWWNMWVWWAPCMGMMGCVAHAACGSRFQIWKSWIRTVYLVKLYSGFSFKFYIWQVPNQTFAPFQIHSRYPSNYSLKHIDTVDKRIYHLPFTMYSFSSFSDWDPDRPTVQSCLLCNNM